MKKKVISTKKYIITLQELEGGSGTMKFKATGFVSKCEILGAIEMAKENIMLAMHKTKEADK